MSFAHVWVLGHLTVEGAVKKEEIQQVRCVIVIYVPSLFAFLMSIPSHVLMFFIVSSQIMSNLILIKYVCWVQQIH